MSPMRPILSCRFFNGSIVTMDPHNPVAGEIITKGDAIAWVGRQGDAPAEFRRAKPVDLKGRLLLPAFSDSHTHFLYFGLSLSRVNLRGISSLRAALRLIAGHTAGTRRGFGWVIGNGFDPNLWGDAGRPATTWTGFSLTFQQQSSATMSIPFGSTQRR